MKKEDILLSLLIASANYDEEIQNKIITVDTGFQSSEKRVSFKDCTFNVNLSTINLYFADTSIRNCEIISTLDSNEVGSMPELNFHNCVFNNNSIKGVFSGLQIMATEVKESEILVNTSSFTLSQSNWVDSKIVSTTNQALLSSFLITSKNTVSVFDLKVNKEYTCYTVVFDKVEINPYYLTTKCIDKKSVDLTRATLTDDWSRLRKKYAGLSLFIIFLLTFLFFLPLITHSFFLLTLNKVNVISPPITTKPLWEVLLFGNKQGWQAWIYGLLTIILLTYNSLRLFVTIQISKLREEENFLKDANFQLVSLHPDKYESYRKIDYVLNWLFWFSICYSVFKLIDALLIAVPAL